jgi:hypothetical protein
MHFQHVYFNFLKKNPTFISEIWVGILTLYLQPKVVYLHSIFNA